MNERCKTCGCRHVEEPTVQELPNGRTRVIGRCRDCGRRVVFTYKTDQEGPPEPRRRKHR